MKFGYLGLVFIMAGVANVAHAEVTTSMLGRVAAKPSVMAYRLPWQDGKSFCLIRLDVDNGLYSEGPVRIRLPEGEPITAARAGKIGAVVPAANKNAVQVAVVHDDGTVGLYFPVNYPKVKTGEKIKSGQEIGKAADKIGEHGTILNFQVVVPQENGKYSQTQFKFTVGKPAVEFIPRDGMKPIAQYSTPATPPRPECNSLDPSKPRFPTGPLDAAYQHKK